MLECGDRASDVGGWKRYDDPPDVWADRRRTFVDQAPKAPCINDFVGFLSIGKELQNDFARVRDDRFRLASAHCGLQNESCGNIDNLPNFPRSSRFVRYQVRVGHHKMPLLTV